VLDLSRKVSKAQEQGLLSMLLTDDQRVAFISYTAGNGDTVLSEFRFGDDGSLDASSERVLFRLGQPAKNHNGGMLQMADGRIFLSLGDGGGAGDTFGNAQNINTFYGGIITLSPTGDPAPTLFAYGLRNPWRFWIDRGLLYIADVGQDAYEEINVVRLEPGQNFGWPITEGRHCYRPTEHCDPTGTVFPVLELEHGDEGACSITGGVVYRGPAIPELDGFYLYSDYCAGFLRGFRYLGDDEIETVDWTDSAGIAGRVTGFGVDGAGEVYVATTTALLRIVAAR
jgi:glucose/arabinose dehydrogenase